MADGARKDTRDEAWKTKALPSLPDIVIRVGVLLRGVYETALKYGFDYDSPEEKLFILKMIEALSEELLDGIDYISEQSQVSKMVHISEALTNTDANTIKEHEFNWLMPELQDECPGNDCKDGKEKRKKSMTAIMTETLIRTDF